MHIWQIWGCEFSDIAEVSLWSRPDPLAPSNTRLDTLLLCWTSGGYRRSVSNWSKGTPESSLILSGSSDGHNEPIKTKCYGLIPKWSCAHRLCSKSSLTSPPCEGLNKVSAVGEDEPKTYVWTYFAVTLVEQIKRREVLHYYDPSSLLFVLLSSVYLGATFMSPFCWLEVNLLYRSSTLTVASRIPLMNASDSRKNSFTASMSVVCAAMVDYPNFLCSSSFT